jgi:hypothetical protein
MFNLFRLGMVTAFDYLEGFSSYFVIEQPFLGQYCLVKAIQLFNNSV